MNAPSDLIAIPPLARTIIYYVLAVALVVCGGVVGGTTGWALALVIVSGLGALFFGTAAARVNAGPVESGEQSGLVIDESDPTL